MFIQLYVQNKSSFGVGLSCAGAAHGAASAGTTPGILVNYLYPEKVAENFKYRYIYIFFTDIFLEV